MLLGLKESYGICFEWEGKDLKAHLIPSPLHGQGHFPQDQAAPSSIQPDLEHLQDREDYIHFRT